MKLNPPRTLAKGESRITITQADSDWFSKWLILIGWTELPAAQPAEGEAESKADAFRWTGDLDDDCTCKWRGLMLRAEAMSARVWWWAVYRGRDEIASSNDAGGWTCGKTGAAARLFAEHAAMKAALTAPPANGGAMMANETRKPFSQRCWEECTRDVIFLFQRRRLILLGVPDDGEWSIDDEGQVIKTSDSGGTVVAPNELFEDGWTFGDHDTPCVLEQWITERVYLTREDGENYGKSRHCNYPDGWRVYGVCAEGELAELIKTT